MQLMLASQSTSKDVALLFSHMGTNYDILSLAQEVKCHHCPVVVFTSYAKSPLAQMADKVFCLSPVHSEVVAEAFTANIAAATYINVIYIEMMQRLGKKGLDSLDNMREAIAKRRS
jgi:DNA-binding MurR/RpiR family transcriptional regulator